MGIIEIAIFTGNSYLGSHVFKVHLFSGGIIELTRPHLYYTVFLFQAVDAGDSIFVHAFGAYFGLGVSFILNRNKKETEDENSLEGSSYTSDLFAMIGDLLLFSYFIHLKIT